MAKVTFERFSELNKLRCESPDGFNHNLQDWDRNEWMVALIGEIGEAANIIKKLNRERDNITGNNLTYYELAAKLRHELADAFIYLDLLAQQQGFSIFEAAIEVFDKKSDQIGCSIKMEPPDM